MHKQLQVAEVRKLGEEGSAEFQRHSTAKNQFSKLGKFVWPLVCREESNLCSHDFYGFISQRILGWFKVRCEN